MSVITKKVQEIHKDGPEFDIDEAIPVEDGNDVLRDCAGGCRKKVLFFGVLGEDAMCLECRTKGIEKKKI